jgi:hypothetical protein
MNHELHVHAPHHRRVDGGGDTPQGLYSIKKAGLAARLPFTSLHFLA